MTTTIDTSYPFAPVPRKEAAARIMAIAAERPMTKMTMPIGGDVWVIHRHSTARAMLSDRRFVREPFRTGERAVPFYVEFPEFLKTTIQFEDPPHHTKLRRLVQRSISPRRIRGMRDSAVAFANERIDDMVRKGPPSNLIDDYTMALPIQMLANLLGVPPEDRPKFERWSASTLAVANMPAEQVAANMEELVQYMTGLIEQRRIKPREDLLSDLANARDKDDSLTDAEILPIALILIVAGFDNTSNFITVGTLSMLNNPDQLAVLLDDIEGNAPSAVEEILRHGGWQRGGLIGGGGGLVPFVATEDVELDGQLVATGEAILFDPNGANHDGIAIEDPERFDIRRSNNPQMTLSYGLHHCLGAPLARMEIEVGISELFRRLPGLRLDGEMVTNEDNLTRPITSFPVSW